MNTNPYVFAVGCPRSGTTLLQRMLDHHPQLSVANDTHFIPAAIKTVAPQTIAGILAGNDLPLTPELVAWVRANPRFARLGLPDTIVCTVAEQANTYREFVSGLYSQLGKMHGKPLAGEKTPDYVRSLPLLHALFPWARFLHIIRDGRDVALSTLEWAKEGRGPRRYVLWNEEPVAICALWWRWNVGIGRREGALLGPHYYAIRYEDLVASPETVLRAVATFLELPYAPEMVDYHQGKTRYAPNLTAKQAWLPPTQGLRDWRAQLSARDTALFEALAGDLLSECDYERRFETIPDAIVDIARQCQEQWDREKRGRTA